MNRCPACDSPQHYSGDTYNSLQRKVSPSRQHFCQHHCQSQQQQQQYHLAHLGQTAGTIKGSHPSIRHTVASRPISSATLVKHVRDAVDTRFLQVEAELAATESKVLGSSVVLHDYVELLKECFDQLCETLVDEVRELKQQNQMLVERMDALVEEKVSKAIQQYEQKTWPLGTENITNFSDAKRLMGKMTRHIEAEKQERFDSVAALKQTLHQRLHKQQGQLDNMAVDLESALRRLDITERKGAGSGAGSGNLVADVLEGFRSNASRLSDADLAVIQEMLANSEKSVLARFHADQGNALDAFKRQLLAHKGMSDTAAQEESQRVSAFVERHSQRQDEQIDELRNRIADLQQHCRQAVQQLASRAGVAAPIF